MTAFARLLDRRRIGWWLLWASLAVHVPIGLVAVRNSPTGSGDFDNDPLTPDEELCSLEVKVVMRDKGKPSVDNISKELLTMCIDTDGDEKCDERIFLFDDRAHDYLWSAENNGLRNAEVRFLEIPQPIGLIP